MRRGIAILLLGLFATGAAAQSSAERRFTLYYEAGYFLPGKATMRSNYARGLYIGSFQLPLADGFGLARQLTERTSVYADLHTYLHTLRSDHRTWLITVPLMVGFRQSFREVSESGRFHLFAGAGVGLCLSRLVAHYYVTTEMGPEIIGETEEVSTYLGMGLRFSLGLEVATTSRFLFGVTLNYDLADGGSADEGGLGNVSGMFAAFRIGVKL